MRRPLLVAAGLLLLTACGGGDDADTPTLPPISPVVPTSAAPSPVSVPVVTKPPEADAETPVGAEAFTRYYIELLNAAFVAVDPGALVPLSDPKCQACNAYIANISEAKRTGKTYIDAALHVREAVAPPDPTEEPTVLANVDGPETKQLDDKGIVLRTESAISNETWQFQLRRQANSWILVEIRT